MSNRLLLVAALSLSALSVRSQTIAAQQPPAAAPGVSRVTVTPLMREGAGLSPQQVSDLEASLQSAPDDLSARARLLGYYFNSSTATANPGAIHEARRRHVLWMIEHHPDSDITRMSELSIDPAGHPLADSAG